MPEMNERMNEYHIVSVLKMQAVSESICEPML